MPLLVLQEYKVGQIYKFAIGLFWAFFDFGIFWAFFDFGVLIIN
jgi:hypothetical protein